MRKLPFTCGVLCHFRDATTQACWESDGCMCNLTYNVFVGHAEAGLKLIANIETNPFP
jgi:hypothetical protein